MFLYSSSISLKISLRVTGIKTHYSAKGSKREIETDKQQSEIIKRNLLAISIYSYVGGRKIEG